MKFQVLDITCDWIEPPLFKIFRCFILAVITFTHHCASLKWDAQVSDYFELVLGSSGSWASAGREDNPRWGNSPEF